jgi:glutamine synthetase
MFVADYIWLDAEGKFRTKTIVTNEISPQSFDGSLTGHSETFEYEMILHPVFKCHNPFKYISGFDCVLVLCDVWKDDHTPHESNSRSANIEVFEYYKNENPLFVFDQEFFLKLPKDSGKHYCMNDNTEEKLCIDEILSACIRADLSVLGIHAAASSSQWCIQLSGYNITAADQLLIVRYIIETITNKNGMKFILHHRPSKMCEGSGCHISVSTKSMMDAFIKMEDIMEKLKKKHAEHTVIYNCKNIRSFTWSYTDKNASVRCNKAQFQDRRPEAKVDPYLACSKLLDTIFS